METVDSRFFDPVYDRRNTGAIPYVRRPPPRAGRDILPLWIADMDFKAPPAVENDPIQKARHGMGGYTDTRSDYDRLAAAWYQSRLS